MDAFKTHITSLESPPIRIRAVIPDDSVDLPTASRALNVATTGSVRVTTVEGETATLTIAAGIPFPIRATRVWASGTTASGIVALS
jgi:hypothetical protein